MTINSGSFHSFGSCINIRATWARTSAVSPEWSRVHPPGARNWMRPCLKKGEEAVGAGKEKGETLEGGRGTGRGWGCLSH